MLLFYNSDFTFGWQAFLLVHGITMFIAGSLGIWLFYIQHTYEDSYFEYDPEWDYVKAAVEGSSYYKLPKVLTMDYWEHRLPSCAPFSAKSSKLLFRSSP